MKNMKILISVILIIIVMIIILLLVLLPKLKEYEEETENLYYGDIYEVQPETTYKSYYIIANCIENYIKYSIENSSEKLDAILENNDYTKENFDEVYLLKIAQVYKIERQDDTTYFVEISLDNKNEYFVTNIDYTTKAYNLRKSLKSEFDNAKNNNVKEKYRTSIKIKQNEFNLVDDKDINRDLVLDKYFYNYIRLAETKPKIAFELLEKSYRAEVFQNDFSNYEVYLENNKSKILNSVITDIQTETLENSTEYIITDNYNRQYRIVEYNYTDYTIALNNYQREDDKYLKLTQTEKVEKNIKYVFELLDNKEYNKVYELLDSDFRNTNFQTYDQFEDYAKNTFFDYNALGKITVQEQGQNYIIEVNYKDGPSSAAEKRQKSFVMRLLEGTEFKISFQID